MHTAWPPPAFPPPPDPPAVAPTAAERERVLDILRDAVSAGTLSVEEFEARLDHVFTVRTRAELDDLVRWVAAPTPASPSRWPLVVGAGAAVLLALAAGVFVGHLSGSESTGAGTAGTTVPAGAGAPTAAAPAAAAPAPTYASAPASTTLAATCAPSVPYEKTVPAYLNQTYAFAPPKGSQVDACDAVAGVRATAPVPGREKHLRLTMVLSGGEILVPSGIGVTPDGRTAPLYTVGSTGIVHVRPDAPSRLTLGQLFEEWGHPLGANGLGSLRLLTGRTIHWFVNGAEVPDPAAVVLRDHDDIVAFEDLGGVAVAPPPQFSWPPELG